MNGSGGCEWNETATGEDECSPPGGSSICYSDGQQDTCATQQEIDDASALLAAAEAELELMEDQSEAEYAEYCLANPQECEEESAVLSGPAAPCGDKYFAAGVSIAASVATVATARSMITGLRLGFLAVAALGATAGIVVGITAVVVTAAYTCYMASEPIPGLREVEPLYY